jgi:hypothetical protein
MSGIMSKQNKINTSNNLAIISNLEFFTTRRWVSGDGG